MYAVDRGWTTTHVYIFKCCRGDFHESLYENYPAENIWGWDYEEAIDEFLFFLELHSGKLTVAAWNIPSVDRKYMGSFRDHFPAMVDYQGVYSMKYWLV